MMLSMFASMDLAHAIRRGTLQFILAVVVAWSSPARSHSNLSDASCASSRVQIAADKLAQNHGAEPS